MSHGYGGYAHLIEDDTALTYRYCSYNVNLDNWQEVQKAEDGEIRIERSALVEPEIHQRVKRGVPGRKQMYVKRTKRDVPWEELFRAGTITVRNASGSWRTMENSVDIGAFRILCMIFDGFRGNGKVPEKIVWFM